MLITMPIFIPLAAAAGASKILTLAALMSGVGAGYTLCFYADTVFMTTASTGVGNITIIQTILTKDKEDKHENKKAKNL